MPSPIANIQINDKEFQKLPQKLAKKAERAVKQTAKMIEAKAAKKAPDRTTNLINSIVTEFEGSGFNTGAKVKATARYAIFVHEGTGIYGPVGLPIFPKTKQALFWPGAAHPVKMVRGMKPRPFLREAFDEEGPKLYQRIFA